MSWLTIDAVSTPDPDQTVAQHRLLVPGEIPSPKSPPAGCRFHTRCRYARLDSCLEAPVLDEVGGGHLAACHHWREIAADPQTAETRSSPELNMRHEEPTG
jgi:oligopeptide/dipeptide ABC transporter ATP-binding protein